MGAPFAYGRHARTGRIRLMIVDDSIVARSVFNTILAPLPDFRIAATASTAEQALAELDRTTVDIVLLDVAMPGRDGLSALPEIIRRGRGARVLIVSASAGEGAEACVRAMTLGAADTLEKPSAGNFTAAFRSNLVDKLRRIGRESTAPADNPFEASEPLVVEEPEPVLRPAVQGPIDCLAIGASTGGLHALSALFGALPSSFAAPILITQHLPASFMPYFAAQIADIAGRPAQVARDGSPLVRGHILVAPGDAHLGLRAMPGGARVALEREAAESGCLPSADPMFCGLSAAFGARGFAVILSGMGRDGAVGAAAVAASGGEVAAQDRGSAVVWGMPGAAARAGLASIVAPPDRIAQRIAERVAAARGAKAAWK
ncbi:MAG TPA: chemotaxis protein CheB [Sphingomonas sp.]|nr:chemotaxis protein CheB [Sphingomonas sp.]